MIKNLHELEAFFRSEAGAVEDWLISKSTRRPTIFTSVDVRYADYKLAPVDTNIFPAGFNNLSQCSREAMAKEVSNYIASYFPEAKNILIFPENHTRNLPYFESLKVLQDAISSMGVTAKIGSTTIASDFTENAELVTVESFAPFERNIANKAGWAPDLIILNNDLTQGVPTEIANVDVPVIPSPNLGWHKRRKHNHFAAYQNLIEEMASHFGFDWWLMGTFIDSCVEIDFRSGQGIECLAKSVELVLGKIQEKYDEYGIKSAPYVFIKADQGTYGMGVTSVKSSEEVRHFNKKTRHSMQVVKSGLKNSNIFIQEGVPTSELYQGHVAESLAYLCNGSVMEIFYRYHEAKDHLESLNSRGMRFVSDEGACSKAKRVAAELATIATTIE